MSGKCLIISDNRNDSFELEDFLHKNGYTYSGGNVYQMRRHPELTNVYINIFDIKNKRFEGFKGVGYSRLEYKTIFKYPKDKSDIINFLNFGSIKPNYKPRKRIVE